MKKQIKSEATFVHNPGSESRRKEEAKAEKSEDDIEVISGGSGTSRNH